MSFIDTNDVVSAFICKHHGSAVADQFTNTFYNSDPFEFQNPNALEYIQATVNDLIESCVFTNIVNVELEQYLESLNEYLKPISI